MTKAVRQPGAFFLSMMLAGVASQGVCAEEKLQTQRYVLAVRAFADAVLEHGRDRYGEQHTPLFVDGLHAVRLEPVRWRLRGETWVLCNFASQQALLRTLDGLTGLTGDRQYRQAAERAAAYALAHLRSPNGLLYWGGHLAWDLEREKAVGQYPDVHELKNHQPYFELMWRVDAPATRQLMESIWGSHVLDWSLLDYNRHASTRKPAGPQWASPFAEDIEVPFPTEGNNLSFVNVTPPLLHSGVTLAVLDRHTNALTWTRRLAYRWQQGREPKTGLCGGQLSFRKDDRAREALGHVHPEINEARIVASYHQTCRYHQLPLVQMQAGMRLVKAGGACAEVGREFIRRASEDLEIYARHSYDPKMGRFVALMTDGTPLKWQESRTGYYRPESFAPRPPDGLLLWGYALAYRLTQEQTHWQMAREISQQLDLGDLGRPDGKHRALHLETSRDDWRLIYASLELFRASRDRRFLQLAARVGDNLLKKQAATGLFPRSGREYARTGDEIPLALLHLATVIQGKDAQVPLAISDHRFFHCEFDDGSPQQEAEKRGDSRTYDHVVFYGE